MVSLPVAEARESMIKRHLTGRAALDVDYSQVRGELIYWDLQINFIHLMTLFVSLWILMFIVNV